jgi:hypothetical protein
MKNSEGLLPTRAIPIAGWILIVLMVGIVGADGRMKFSVSARTFFSRSMY